MRRLQQKDSENSACRLWDGGKQLSATSQRPTSGRLFLLTGMRNDTAAKPSGSPNLLVGDRTEEIGIVAPATVGIGSPAENGPNMPAFLLDAGQPVSDSPSRWAVPSWLLPEDRPLQPCPVATGQGTLLVGSGTTLAHSQIVDCLLRNALFCPAFNVVRRYQAYAGSCGIDSVDRLNRVPGHRTHSFDRWERPAATPPRCPETWPAILMNQALIGWSKHRTADKT